MTRPILPISQSKLPQSIVMAKISQASLPKRIQLGNVKVVQQQQWTNTRNANQARASWCGQWGPFGKFFSSQIQVLGKFLSQIQWSALKTRRSKLCGFCVIHTATCEPSGHQVVAKWFPNGHQVVSKWWPKVPKWSPSGRQVVAKWSPRTWYILAYLIFVIFFTQPQFEAWKFYT